MDLQHLLYFKKTAELESVTDAAAEMRVAQPALSRIIRDLESELGAPLFDRRNHRVYLNENGRILLRYAQHIDSCMAQFQTELHATDQQQQQSILILLKSTPVMLPGLIHAFMEHTPALNIEIITYNRSIHDQNLSFDFAIVSTMRRVNGSNVMIPLFSEEMVLAVSRSHALANGSIRLIDAANENFFSLPSDYQYYHEFKGLCKKAGFTPKIALETTDYYTISALVESGEGIALVPRYSWGFQNNAQLSLVKLASPVARNTIFLSLSDQLVSRNLHKRFIRFAQSYFVEYQNSIKDL